MVDLITTGWEPKKKKRMAFIFVTVLSMLAVPVVADENIHPATYIDQGACPFECCTYREWSVEKATDIQISPDITSKIVGTVEKGTKVEGITGIVEVNSPGKIEVVKKFRSYKKGDIMWVYTYLGEGFFKVWVAGKMYEEEIPFLLHGEGGGWARCVEDGTCWGKVIAKPQTTWWVKIKNKEGLEGWSNKPQNFGNKDSCG